MKKNLISKELVFSFLFKASVGVLLVLSAMLACSTEPKVQELSASSDPQVELDLLDAKIKQAQEEQVDILSPKNFEAAINQRDNALEARANNKKQEVVLHEIALSQAYLAKANAVSNVAIELLKGPSEARHDAVAAKAGTHFAADLLAADKKFKKLTESIEKNDTSGAEKNRAPLEANYRDIELRAIKKERLGPAQSIIQDAINEGAKKLTPETLVWAEKQYAKDEAIVENNRHNNNELVAASNEATEASSRLLRMVREAKGSTAKNPEERAKQIEKSELAVAQSKKDLVSAAAVLGNTQGKLANASAKNDKLESQVWLDNEYEKARRQFTTDEAEVYKQGGTLLLRLKGLTFAINNAGINSSNFPLLAKVQKVIGDVGLSTISIEGHTDSIGGKKLNEELSAKRAESVLAYLVENKNISPDKITATGFGDSKPIATNKTNDGRAQNRRVDVIITSDL